MRFTFYLTTFAFFSFIYGNAQQKKQLSVDINRSFTGTGDMRGVGFAVEYGNYIRKRVELTGALSSDIHYDQYKLLLVQFGNTTDASYRRVAAGMQLHGQINYAPLLTKRNELRLGAGPLLRYQSSSASGGYGVYGPAGTNFPEPVFTFRQVEDQNIVSAGYLVSFSYAYTFGNKLIAGIKASFQNDTNADVITQYGFRVGKRF